METRLNFFYLCVDECLDDEWDCRWNLFNLHDTMARVALMIRKEHLLRKLMN
jgi:hypothetical protein